MNLLSAGHRWYRLSFWGLLACTALFCQSSFADDSNKPNVVVILVDDLGWMDLSCQGSDYFKTPNIDALAAGGMRFTNAYAACAVCSPTRAAMMTGKYPDRVGITDWIRARFQRGKVGTPKVTPTKYVGSKNTQLLCPPNPYWMEHEEVTFAERFKAAGYATAFIGKWHLGDPDWYPTRQGFDINIGGCDLGQPPSYFDPYRNKRYAFDGGLEPRQKGEFLTHREADEAKSFINNHKDNPFLLYYCPYAVHTPIQAIKKVAQKYQREGKTAVNAKYAALVESVDDAVGTIVAALDLAGVRDNTLIVFTSDNGGLKGPTDNRPLRSGKGYAYEGGIRVPAIINWPGVVAAGATSDSPIISMDFMLTITEAAGIKIETGAIVDGVSLLQHAKSGGQTALARRVLHWHFPHYRHPPGPYSIIRDSDWKLIRWYQGPIELYNLKNDLGEQNNLVDSHPSKAAQLDRKLSAALAETGAKLPKPNPDYVQQ